jgi:signal peptidase I
MIGLSNNKEVRSLQNKILLFTGLIILILSVVWLAGQYGLAVYGNALPVGQIAGDSMLPAYHNGEWVYYYTPDKREVQLGDVIVFTKTVSGDVVAHRVVQINPDGTMITKGDHNKGTDQEMGYNKGNVTMSQVLGIVGGPVFGSE